MIELLLALVIGIILEISDDWAITGFSYRHYTGGIG